MAVVSFALVTLTRPSKVLIELNNPEKVKDFLRYAYPTNSDDDFSIQFIKVKNQDSWICIIDIMGLIKLRYGIEVKNNYLIISNIPWSQEGEVHPSKEKHLLSAALSINPDAGRLQLPGLFDSAMEQQRKATLSSAAYLYPILLASNTTIAQAQKKHKQLFGFTPIHPGNGEWHIKNKTLFSSQFGNFYEQTQPLYSPGNRDFGALDIISKITLSMQFEEDGLRTQLRWSLRKTE